MKKIFLIAAAVILILGACAGGILLWTWHSYEMPQIKGDTAESESDDLEEISWKWFSEYFRQFHGIFVPPNYHIVHARIEDMELLTDLDTPYIQIDYEVYAPFGGSGIVKELELMDTDTRWLYTGQMVLCW